jgi:hypothetical protein
MKEETSTSRGRPFVLAVGKKNEQVEDKRSESNSRGTRRRNETFSAGIMRCRIKHPRIFHRYQQIEPALRELSPSIYHFSRFSNVDAVLSFSRPTLPLLIE